MTRTDNPTGQRDSTPPAPRSSTTRWLAAGLAVSVTAAVVLAVLLATRDGPRTPTSAQRYAAASASVAALLEQRIDRFNAGDMEAAAATYADNGVLDELEPPWKPGETDFTTVGRARIATRLAELYRLGLRMDPAGPPLQLGSLVGEPVRFRNAADPAARGQAILVFQVEHGLIAHQWMVGWVGEAPGT